MFDREVSQHAGIVDQIGRQYHKHVSAVVTIDVSQVGWAPNGSSGGVVGQFDYEGNGLIVVPKWMRASDLTISQASGTGSHLDDGPQIYVFMNTKDNPGIPININAQSQFAFDSGFASICCSFKRFFVYVQQHFAGRVMQLAVLKGLDLSGCGSSFRSSGAEIVGCYNAGDTYV